MQNLRLAVRSVLRARASTAAILVTLALAIGGTTAMFSVVHAVVMEPLPYPGADRLVRVWERHVPRNRDRNVVAPANFMEWRDRSKTVADLSAYSSGTVSLTGDGAPERVPSLTSTPALYPLLGVEPQHGRVFTSADAVENAERVVMMGWNLWQRRYGADPAIVNRSLTVNGRPARVIGILPRGFRLFGADYDVWSVLELPEAARAPRGRSLQVVGRLAPGASLAGAQAEMDLIADALVARWPDFNAGWRIQVVDARADMLGGLERPLTLLLVAVAVVLLAGCANAANLLLARAADRRREFEVRAALGASRGRLFGQLAAEGLVLGSAGTIAGLGVAVLALGAIVDVAGPAFGVPRLENASLNVPVLAAAVAVLGLCTLAFALAPGWLATRAAAAPLQTGARVWTGGRVERRLRASLVVAQVGFAVLLVICAGLVGRSLSRLVAVDPGFDPDRVLTLTVSLPASSYSNEQQVAFFARAADELRAIAGVTKVGAISWLPFSGPGGATSFDVDGRPPLPPADRPVADIRPVDAGYFDTMAIPVVRGRTFTPQEIRAGARLAVVNEDLVRRIFPNEDPIGRRLQVNWNEGLDEIIGVVRDVRISGLAADPRSQIYFPQGSANVGFVSYVVRTSLDDPAAIARQAVAAIQGLDPSLPVRDVRPMQAWIDASVAAPRLAVWLVGAFGGLALCLALVGIAGLQAAAVAARQAEFGIRLALGATPSRIRAMVLSQAARLIVAGLVLGLVAAVTASRLVEGLLFNTAPTDPVTYVATTVSMLALGLLACAGAVRRATRADPAAVLK